jgi:hypothetical protein
MAELKNGNSILFLCDRKACGDVCPNANCSHTGDINHAKNFDVVKVGPKLWDYFELNEEGRPQTTENDKLRLAGDSE